MAVAKLLILDANVLIDYAHSELRPLGLWVKRIGAVYVPRLLLREVEELSEETCRSFGMELLDPSMEQLAESAQDRPGLSFEDRLCLVLARDGDLTCVTNDRRLRKECDLQGVRVMWGLEIMISLVRRNNLELDHALRIAGQIHDINPGHITGKVLDRFRAKAKGASHQQ